ncbi:MAG: ATP-binding protein [Thermodesulfobacteriota bacterium]
MSGWLAEMDKLSYKAADILKKEQEIARIRQRHDQLRQSLLKALKDRDETTAFEGEEVGPVLVGLRPDGTRVAVEAMSRGSRDQLYLALRMATLNWRLEIIEPIPFIVDDILINFDDARSRATLQALADLSEKTRVILFTHHGRIVDQAETIENGTVQIHEL